MAIEGKRQSPIDIETSKIIDGSSVTSSKPLTWSYQLDHCLNIENTGASWKVNVNGTGSCKLVIFLRVCPNVHYILKLDVIKMRHHSIMHQCKFSSSEVILLQKS